MQGRRPPGLKKNTGLWSLLMHLCRNFFSDDFLTWRTCALLQHLIYWWRAGEPAALILSEAAVITHTRKRKLSKWIELHIITDGEYVFLIKHIILTKCWIGQSVRSFRRFCQFQHNTSHWLVKRPVLVDVCAPHFCKSTCSLAHRK